MAATTCSSFSTHVKPLEKRRPEAEGASSLKRVPEDWSRFRRGHRGRPSGPTFGARALGDLGWKLGENTWLGAWSFLKSSFPSAIETDMRTQRDPTKLYLGLAASSVNEDEAEKREVAQDEDDESKEGRRKWGGRG